MCIPFLSLLKRRFLQPFFVLFLLSGCGQPSVAQHPQKPTAPLLCRSATPTFGPAPLGTSVAFDLGGCIHVQSASGFTCSAGAQTPPGLLVLPTVRPTYDQGTLQSVQNYVTLLYKNPGDTGDASGVGPHHRDTVPYPAFSANPSAFQLVAVDGCNEFLQITNIRNTPLQITPASVTFTADSQSNTQHYNLIDDCSLLSLAPCLHGGNGGGAGEYSIKFDLHPGKTNTIIPATTIGNLKNNTFTLQPGEVAEVMLDYGAPDNFSFSLMPSFTIGLPGEQPTTYPVPQLQETFASALPSQFSCYSLQGQQFIEVSGIRYDSDVWCI